VADKVPDLPKLEGGFNAKAYSDRLQETRVKTGLAPALAFDKSKPDSIVPFADYVRGPVYERVQALIEFTGAHEVRLNGHDGRFSRQDARLDALEAARVPFGSPVG